MKAKTELRRWVSTVSTGMEEFSVACMEGRAGPEPAG